MFAAHRLLLLALLIVSGCLGFYGEKIPVNNHTGWDGKHYANLTIHFEDMALQKQIDSYQYQRILTPAVIHYTAKVLGIELNQDTIVSVFSACNLILILCCALLFFDLSIFLQITRVTEIIGFSGLFLNYVILKNTFYYPVLTDTTAFFMGFCVTWLFIRRYNTLLFITALIGQFCYPLFLIASLPLALAIRNNTITGYLHRFHLYRILAAACIVLVLAGFYMILLVPGTLLPRYTLELNRLWLPLSIGMVIVYLWRSISLFQNVLPVTSASFDWKKPLLQVIAVASFILITSRLISNISIPEEVFTPVVFVYNILQQSIDNPSAFLIAHIIYLGPALILILFFYKPFIQTISELGDSAIAYFFLMLVLSIGSETRQFIHFYPFIIVVLMITLNHYTFSLSRAILFASLSIVASKCWLTINRPESFTHYLYAEFPDQLYFMNHGPFMSDQSYLINTSVIIIEASIIWFLFKRKQQSPA